MAIYKRIMVPVDGSTASERALQEAIRLADANALIHAVYVLGEIFSIDAESFAFMDYAALQEAMRKSGERILAQAAEMVRQSGVAVETLLLEANGDHVASVINEEALHWRADLIVIGTHGRSGLSRVLLGSVAEGVVRTTLLPVLLIHAG